MVEKVTIIIAILAIIYLGIKAFMGSLSAHALIYYMLEKNTLLRLRKKWKSAKKRLLFAGLI